MLASRFIAIALRAIARGGEPRSFGAKSGRLRMTGLKRWWRAQILRSGIPSLRSG